MSRKSLGMLTIGAALVALAAAPTLAGPGWHGPRHGGPMGGPHPLHGIADALDLTDAQREQIRGIWESHLEGELGEVLAQLRDAHDTVRDLVHDANATDEQVAQAARAATEPAIRAAVLRHNMVLEIDALLTPEQREKAAMLREMRDERREARREARREGRRGARRGGF
jgi:Spy/CpxP family protein refolding chaperone